MRIGSIDVYKFFFACVMCFYHFGSAVSPNRWFPMGNIVVELFTLISGIFFFRSWERLKKSCLPQENDHPSEEAYTFLKKRFLRFFPYTTTAFLFAAIVRAFPYIVEGTLLNDHRILKWFSQDIWEILLIKMNGMGITNSSGLLNVPLWTVSAILIVEFIVFALLLNWEKAFTTFICPCSILAGFGLWSQLENISYRNWIGFTTFGVLRVFIVICLSYYCCKLIKNIENTKLTAAGKIFLSAAEWSLYGISHYLIMNFNTRPFRWLTILFFFFAVAITMSGNCYSNIIFFHSKITDYLGEMSLGLYLIHYPIYRMFKFVWTEPYEMFKHKLLYGAAVLIAANIFLWIVKWNCSAGGVYQ